MSSNDPIINLFKPYLGVDFNLLTGLPSQFFYDSNKNPILTSPLDFAGTQYKSYAADKTTPIDMSNKITAENTGLIYYSSPDLKPPGPILGTSGSDLLYSATSIANMSRIATEKEPVLIKGSNGVTIPVPGNGRYPLPRLTTESPTNIDSLSDGFMLTSFTKGAGTPTTNRARLEAPTGYLITGIKCAGVNYWVRDGTSSYLSTITHIFATPIVNLLVGSNDGTLRIGMDSNGTKMSEIYAQNTKFDNTLFDGGKINPDNFTDWMLPAGHALVGFKLIDKYAIHILVLLSANVAEAAKGNQVWTDTTWIHAATTNASSSARRNERGWHYLISTRPNEAERKSDFVVGFQYFNQYLTRGFEAIKYVTIGAYAKWLSDRSSNYDMVKLCCDPTRNPFQLSNRSTTAICKPYYFNITNSNLEESINYPVCDVDMTKYCKIEANQTTPICSCIIPLDVLAPGGKLSDTGQPNMCWWKACRENGYKNLENRMDYGKCPSINICDIRSQNEVNTLNQGRTDNVKISQSCNINNAPPPAQPAPPAPPAGGGTTPPPAPPAGGGTTPPPTPAPGNQSNTKPPADDKDDGLPDWAIAGIVIVGILIVIFIIIAVVYSQKRKNVPRLERQNASYEEAYSRPRRLSTIREFVE